MVKEEEEVVEEEVVDLEEEGEGHGLVPQDLHLQGLHRQGQGHGWVPQDPHLPYPRGVQQQEYLEHPGAEEEALEATINPITVFLIGKGLECTTQHTTGLYQQICLNRDKYCFRYSI